MRHAIPRPHPPPDDCCKTTAPSNRAYCVHESRYVHCPSSSSSWLLSASNQLPLMNNLSVGRTSNYLWQIFVIGGNGGRRTAAAEGMFTSTRKICFVLCGGRRGEGPQSHEGPGSAAGYRAGNQRSTGPTAEGKRKARLDLMSDNDAKCIAETPEQPPWDGM